MIRKNKKLITFLIIMTFSFQIQAMRLNSQQEQCSELLEKCKTMFCQFLRSSRFEEGLLLFANDEWRKKNVFEENEEFGKEWLADHVDAIDLLGMIENLKEKGHESIILNDIRENRNDIVDEMGDKLKFYFSQNKMMKLRNNESVCLNGVCYILLNFLDLKRTKFLGWELRIFMGVFCRWLAFFIVKLKMSDEVIGQIFRGEIKTKKGFPN